MSKSRLEFKRIKQKTLFFGTSKPTYQKINKKTKPKGIMHDI